MGGKPSHQGWTTTMSLSQQFSEYDCYVIATPMWNFTIPYKLKQYIDNVIQPGICFQYTQTGVEGLLTNKKMYIVSAHGSYYSQEPMNQFNFLEPYLRSIFGFTGITDIHSVTAQPVDISPELSVAAIESAKSQINQI